MEATHITKDKITVAFSRNEIALLSNAINETLNAVEAWEFQTRTGESPERAKEILAKLGEMLDKSKQI